jgi:hypothetical protein
LILLDSKFVALGKTTHGLVVIAKQQTFRHKIIQKLDKFDTNNQKIDQTLNFDSSYQKSNLPWCKLFSHFDQSMTGK